MPIQHPYQKILTSLSRAKVRYLVAGGIAMNIHGLERSTVDLDLIVFLERNNILRFAGLMRRLGYRPKLPVEPEAFAEEQLRKKWIREKNMVVFSFHHPKNPFEIIDIFVDHPRPFDEMFKASKAKKLLGQVVRAVGLEDMLFLKRKAMRIKDQFDIRYLEGIIRKKRED